MTDPLLSIRDAWIAWSMQQIGEVEFAARVADALEMAGVPLIGEVIAADNDEKDER